jgi:DNA replication protein DnaC
MTDSPSDEIHTCPVCNQVVPKKHLSILGVPKVIQPRCKCEVEHWERGIMVAVEKQQKDEIERKFSFSALGERFNDCRFGTFAIREGAELAARMCAGYAKNFDDYGGDSLLIWGTPGNGKSHLAAGVCHVLKDNGKIPVFQSVPELLERIRSTFSNKKETEKEIMDALRDCDLLVMDDIGAEKISDWVLETLFRIIDGRYRAKKPTLFTTNFSPMELLNRFMPKKPSAEDEIAAKRIHDRIIEISTIVENKASSYRMEVAVNRKNMDPEGKRKWG